MHNHHRHNAHPGVQGFLSGALIGGLMGTAVALLAAPQSGKKTRAQIRLKSLELRDQAAETIDEARQRTKAVAREARLKARQLKRSAETTVKELQDRGQTLLEEQTERVGSVLEALQPAAKDGGS